MTSHLRECWYPVVRSDDLCEAPLSGSSLVRPYGIRLLGDPLVLFREVGGRVCALSDRCPHRSAPLSLGRLRDGRLECTYHGWQFDAQGACQRIPSLAPDSREHQRRTRQAAATSYPTHEQYGFVWVWPQPGAEVDSALLPHHLFTRTSSPEWIANHGMRDLEIDHGLMIENLLDPSHLPFTHENTLAKRSDAEDMSMDVVYDSLGEEGTDLSDECSQPTEKQPTIITEEIRAAAKRRVPGFSRLLQGHCKRASKPDSGYFSFIPPYTVVLDIPISPTRRMIQLQFCVPLTPHKMRLQFVFLRNFATQVGHFGGLVVWWFGGLVVWWFGGLVVWWFGGLVVWWFGGLVVWWFGGLVVWWFGGLVVWWFGGLVVWWFGTS
eukprot:CAMPEP_0177661834 /NCGR_PEP_ID=MMETSP0447-20121125/18928_1 /TAXON_ID=0 /ORGANISM="Stygamoeba regulata, Strain BSH-02190019" /LENGTH=378 /DNA_ID=CAMNT_0019167279 /DNA_START=53 /DNA_END=1189 /DNA_ORIENTATION=-